MFEAIAAIASLRFESNENATITLEKLSAYTTTRPSVEQHGRGIFCNRGLGLASDFLRFCATVIQDVHAFFNPGVNAIGIKPILGQQ